MAELPNNDVAVERVGIRDLRQDLRAWLERARRGERIIITDRGVPVAELVPHRDEDSLLRRMIAEGRALPAAGGFRVGYAADDSVTHGLSAELQRMRDGERGA